jgi:flagellar basal-body rod modification protein FlgD
MNTINVNSSLENHLIDTNNNNNAQNVFNPLDLQKNFLTLLMAQIKNQDPTDPIKNTELTSQLAQINTASGIERLNNAVGQVSNQINQQKNIEVSSLLGHHIMVPSNQIIHTENVKTNFGVELIGKATSIKIEIKDHNGKTLHVINKTNEDNISSGIHHFTWNGKDLNNQNVKTGKYDIVITAKNNDKNIPALGLSEEVIQSIITSSDNPIFDLGASRNITLEQIREVLQ